MIEIEKPRIDCEQLAEDGSYGKFVVEPLERGYGTTLGNSLRRILLSSLPGTAASSIKIAGVQHEFSTIPGVKEDVTEIVLNVKRHHRQAALRWAPRRSTSRPPARARSRPAISTPTARLRSSTRICTSATLMSRRTSVNMEITMTSRPRLCSGREEQARTRPAIGVIPVDSIYTPVYKVNYTVENTRVGDLTDYDKLTLEVWTDCNHQRTRRGFARCKGSARPPRSVRRPVRGNRLQVHRC